MIEEKPTATSGTDQEDGGGQMDEEKKIELLNELRSEMLDRRAARLNRWLQVVGLVLAFFAVVAAAAGFTFSMEFRRINEQADRFVEKAEDTLRRLRDIESAAGVEAEKIAQLAKWAGETPPPQQQDTQAFLATMGFEPHDFDSGQLRNNQDRRIRFSVPRGEYWLAGECDDDCSDLDLSLYVGGDLVASDFLLDNVPVVRYESTDGADLELEVIMADCRAASCYWEVTVFLRQLEDQP